MKGLTLSLLHFVFCISNLNFPPKIWAKQKLWVWAKKLGWGENFRFGRKFWVQAKILGLSENFRVWVKILGSGENFGFERKF